MKPIVKVKVPMRKVARAVHEINRIYCEAIGDRSQPKWDDAPDWQVASTKEGIIAIIDDPKITHEQQHENWRRLKASDGWIYGLKKDAAKKTHPCMVDYRDLPIEQRAKDTIFGAVVRGLLGIE